MKILAIPIISAVIIVGLMAKAAYSQVPGLGVLSCTRDTTALFWHDQWGQEVVESHMGPDDANPNKDVFWQLWVNPDNNVWSLTKAQNGLMCIVLSGTTYDGRTIQETIDGARGIVKPQGIAL